MVDIRREALGIEPDTTTGTRSVASRTVFSLSEDETLDLGRSVARCLSGGELILLEGELGLGKTVFARGLAAGLGVVPEEVTSPSFTLIQEYRNGRLPIYHADLYRLDTDEDLETLGFEELLASGGVLIVEWGDKLPPYLRRDAITIRFHDVGEDSRRIQIVGNRPPKRRGDA